MAVEVYSGSFRSLINDNQGFICITNTHTTTKPVSSDEEFDMPRNSTVLSYHGEEDNIHLGIIPSSMRFTFIADSEDKQNILNQVISSGDETWYVLYFEGSSLKWWGYLNLETFSINREYKPRYNFEAFDKLTLCGQQSFWGYRPTDKTLRTNSIFQMGWRINTDPSSTTQIYGNGWNWASAFPYAVPTTLLGIIYSCLFDTDQLNLGQQDLKVVNWDTSTNPQTTSAVPGISRTLENWNCVGINDYFFQDPPAHTIFELQSGEFNKDWLISDILNNLCKLFRARLFQKDGSYYFVQWEAYQGDTTAGNMRVHNYNNAQRATPSYNLLFPDFTATSVISVPETDIDTYPRTDPEIEPGTNIEYIQSADKVSLKVHDSPEYKTESTYEIGRNFTTIATSPFTNFSQAVRRIVTMSTAWGWSHFRHYVYSGGIMTQNKQTTWRYDGSTYKSGTIPEHLVSAMAQYSNGIRKKLNVRMRGSYEIFNLVTLDSVSYLCTNLTTNLESEQHSFQGVEFSAITTNLSEVDVIGSRQQQVPIPGTSPVPIGGDPNGTSPGGGKDG